MKAIRLEFARSGNPAGNLEKGREYFVSIDSEKHHSFPMPLGHLEMLDLLAMLRYDDRVSDEEREAALRSLSDAVTPVLNEVTAGLDDNDVQLDLITNARELWALPLEAALAGDERPRFARADRRVVLTRRTPRPFAERALSWPAQPRVLFVHASPRWASASPARADEHLEILRDVLAPYMPPLAESPVALPDESHVVTVLPDATLRDIDDAYRKAEKDRRPYTHVHLLAHGVRMEDPRGPHRDRYGIALCSADNKPTPAEALAKILRPSAPDETRTQELPVVVSLASCDSANAVNTLMLGGVAQELHHSGVPVVIASQLPLTFAGAKIMLREFYAAWLEGCDVREALHRTRVALHDAKDANPPEARAGHDWVSLVAYVRLPEGYADYLFEIRLQSQLAALENASRFADHLVLNNVRDDWQFDLVTRRVQERIERLHAFQQEIPPADKHRRRDVLLENAGMLGSAHKRLAELMSRRAAADSARRAHWLEQSRAAMEEARQVYRNAFLSNTSHHWSGVQYLALEAVLTGRIANVGEWWACQVSAANARDHAQSSESDRIWAQGSLAELTLLAPLAPGAPVEPAAADAALGDLCRRVRAAPPGTWPVLSPIDSTRRQLLRYVGWWSKRNGFFGDRDTDLSAEAERLVRLLDG